MQAFDSLSRDIQQYIYDKGWPSLTRIQNAAIKQVANTDHNLILSAPTASGENGGRIHSGAEQRGRLGYGAEGAVHLSFEST